MGLENLKNEQVKSQDCRKIKKPLIEKQRRKRINNSLHELKKLVLAALNRDITLYEKMEKADVLDLTVNYIKSTQCRKQENKTSLTSYQAGYRDCQEHMNSVLLNDVNTSTNQKRRVVSSQMTNNQQATMHHMKVHVPVFTTTYPLPTQFTITPPRSPLPSPTMGHVPLSSIEGLSLLSTTAELRPNRKLSYNQSPTTKLWRPW